MDLTLKGREGERLWQTRFDRYTGRVVAEFRAQGDRSPSLAAADVAKGVALWEGARPEGLHWWHSLAEAAGGRFFLTEYPEPAMPEAKGLAALDTRTGRLLWAKEEVRLLEARAETVLVSESGARKGFWLESASGKPIAKPETEPEPPFPLLSPALFAEGERDRAVLAQFVRERTGYAPNGPLAFLEHGGKLFFGYAKGEGGSGALLLADGGGRVLRELEIPGQGLRGAAEGFRIFGDRLAVAQADSLETFRL